MSKQTSKKQLNAAFASWVGRSGLISWRSARGGFGIIGTAELMVRRGKVSVQVCVPSSNGYPGGFGYDLPVSSLDLAGALRFFEAPYEIKPSIDGHYTAAPMVIGHECC